MRRRPLRREGALEKPRKAAGNFSRERERAQRVLDGAGAAGNTRGFFREAILARHVRGSFFVEYVRMIRRRKDVNWMGQLRVEDLALVQQHITPETWYPMASFERLGLAILANFEGAGLDAVRLWGSYSAHQFVRDSPTLLADGDPVETLMRLRVQRATLFDFPAFDIPTLTDGHAVVTMSYGMGAVAEEAACHQTLGFCESMVALAGGQDVTGALDELSWTGAPTTTLILSWAPPRRARSSARPAP